MDAQPLSLIDNLWMERFERFRATNMTVAQFCHAEGVSTASYYYWRKKLRSEDTGSRQDIREAPPGFVPVTLVNPALAGNANTVMRIELPGGVSVRLEITGDSRRGIA